MEWMIKLILNNKAELEHELSNINKDVANLIRFRLDIISHIEELDKTLKLIRK